MTASILFDPARHEPLSGDEWTAVRAREAIAAIVTDIERHVDPVRGWPTHPNDDGQRSPMKSLYLGASGVLWSLWYLAREGAVTLAVSPADLVRRVHADYLEAPDTGSVVPSYLLGEVGVLLVDWRLTGSADAARRMEAAIRENIPNPTNEALWAAPGTMVAAWHMWTWTGESRWRLLFQENVEQLFRTWHRSEHAPCFLWTQDMYRTTAQYIGAGHGFAGNVDSLLRGIELLTADQRALLMERCVETLQATVMDGGDRVNWMARVGPQPPDRRTPLVQWCHGSPGIVTALAHYPPGNAALDDLLRGAGNLVWEAGPLVKGHGLCHGTAGNGYAFLALHERTGDAIWLERARAFAMHAIGQQQRMREAHGQGRYTLWTGDPGLAVYLWHCLQGKGALPGLDVA